MGNAIVLRQQLQIRLQREHADQSEWVEHDELCVGLRESPDRRDLAWLWRDSQLQI